MSFLEKNMFNRPVDRSLHCRKQSFCLLSIVFVVLFISPFTLVEAQEADEITVISGCEIIGFKEYYRKSTPAFHKGSNIRNSELGAQIEFPVVPISYDPLSFRYSISLSDAEEVNSTTVVELLKAHLVTQGNGCEEKLVRVDEQRCLLADASSQAGVVGSNDGSCDE